MFPEQEANIQTHQKQKEQRQSSMWQTQRVVFSLAQGKWLWQKLEDGCSCRASPELENREGLGWDPATNSRVRPGTH